MGLSETIVDFFGPFAETRAIEIAKHFYRAGLLHAAEQDLNVYNNVEVDDRWIESAAIHRKAAENL